MHRAIVVLLVGVAACDARASRGADSSGVDSARAAATAGDLSGPPRADTTPPAPAATQPSVHGEPPTRGDGRATNPPIHRTNPRDEDVMSPAGDDRASALLGEIRRLARADGCAKVGDCATLPVGRKACGGPRSYVVYCATTTDVAALRRTIGELDALDRAATAKGAVSDCLLVAEPRPVLSGGACRAEGAAASVSPR